MPGTLVRDLPVHLLEDVEREWSPARKRLAVAAAAAGVELESSHWDWREKVSSVGPDGHRLFAVECEGQVQGLMAVVARPRPSRLVAANPLVYVDYLEAAPWNLALPGQPPRLLGVGTVLVGEAVKQSLESGMGGRIGLHALPQAERFYADRCRMTRHAPDPAYYNLVYFELAAGDAARWLADRGL